MKKLNVYLFVTALLLVVIGVICIIHPLDIFAGMAWLVGLLILLAGCTTIFFGLRAQRVLPNAGSTTMLGVLGIVIGIIFLGNNILAEGVIAVVFSMWVLFEGISLLMLAFSYKRNGYDKWWIMLLLGICSAVLGLLALTHPIHMGAFMGVLIGIGIFANGVVRLVALVALKHITSALHDSKESAEALHIDDQQKPEEAAQ